MIFFRAVRYLKYITLAHHRKGHGIHSPFVYDLVSRVFRNKIDPGIVLLARRCRKKMDADRRSILVNDLGAGSVSLKKKNRKVSDIARLSSVPVKYGRFLSRMAAEFGEPEIIELGTSLGISGIYLAAACKNAVVRTVEGSGMIAAIARQNFQDSGLINITVTEAAFDDILPSLAVDTAPGLVFIDGNHRKEPVLKYFKHFADRAGSKTVIIIDDINYSEEMAAAWEEIKSHKNVSVSVDIFRMGICFFREGINHNNYVIRY